MKKPPRGGLGPNCAVATQKEECNARTVHGTVSRSNGHVILQELRVLTDSGLPLQ